MKSFINKGIHRLLRMAHNPTPCTDSQREEYLGRARSINQELSTWLGDEHFEMIGLGQNCNASWYIKESGNKTASYPLDWIFTTPEIILDMLADDFQSFRDPQMLIPHGMDAGHERYHETFFGHRNPASNKSDREYFDRCVERWNEHMQAQKPTLFLTIVLNESQKRKRWKEGFTKQFKMPENQRLTDFDEMMRTISSINPNSRFIFLEQETEGDFELEVEFSKNRAAWIKFTSIDKNTGVQYLHKVDDAVMKGLLRDLVGTQKI